VPPSFVAVIVMLYSLSAANPVKVAVVPNTVAVRTVAPFLNS
jgi:hypothetical protein